ncbi:MAG: hypothetical protein ACPGR2_02120 [Psychrobium sp.]
MPKSIKKGLYICCIFTLCSCGGIDKGNFTDQQICIATIAKIMGKNPEIIKIDSIQDNVTHLSYIRASDRKHWAYRCKINGDNAIWAASKGRWRTHEDDSRITFAISESKIKISETFSDGSGSAELYRIDQLND